MTKQEQQVAPGALPGTSTGALERRKFKGYLVKPRFQLKFAYHMVAVGFGFFCGTILLAGRKLAEIEVLLQQNHVVDAFVRNQILEAYSVITQIALAGLAGYVFYVFVYAMLMTHRISGPMISIVAFIDELTKGNYEYKGNLRRRDELFPIMKGLQQLARVLSSHGKRSDPSDPG